LPRHEHFEELAAIAARGELTPSEEHELSLHLADCDSCRQIYEEYEELRAPLRPLLEPKMEAAIESSRDRVKSAVLQAIRAPQGHTPMSLRNDALLPAGAVRWNALRPIWTGLAAAAALALVFWLGVRYGREANTASGQSPDNAVVQTVTSASAATESQANKPPRDPQYERVLSDLQAEKQRGAKLDAALAGKGRELAESEKGRLLVQQRLDSQSANLEHMQTLLASKTDEFNRLEAAKWKDSTTLVALEYQVQDLTEKLAEQKQSLQRERDLLANGRDVRDIIGARNLHIIDVYDTDPEGNTRKSFARAFYTEGKSLIFYAYDLPARRTEDGKFVYAAWGEKNGNKKTARNLGILLNDDKGQKRWVLNFSDPKVLAEIDSVFVTLERADSEGEQPSGKRMLTAYLDSRVNHP
jgi:hypothetical protein